LTYLENFEKWCWGRMEKISWTNRVKMKKYYIGSRGKEHHKYDENREG
jgi:hypothetical protein